jgi:1-acyl-sn-glycerol-3-phosphate acyltransferase
MARSLMRAIIRFLFWALTRLDVQGAENIPARGGGLLVSNHLGLLDGPLIFSLIERPNSTALVADKYQQNPLFRLIVNVAGGIWINRESADIQAIRRSQEYIAGGGLLGVAPEGTRSPNGQMQEAKTGAAFLAAKVGEKTPCPIVPLAVWGTENVVRKVLLLQRPKIHVRIAPAFTLPPLSRKDRAAGLQAHTDEIMCRIAALLPPHYRGFYAHHPCLKELLVEEGSEPG